MAQLGELLTGMLTDVVRARMAADAVSARALAAYRADPVLASLSVPRVLLSDLTVKLSFAVVGVDVAERPDVPVENAQAEWAALVGARISPLVPRRPRPFPPTPATKPEPIPFDRGPGSGAASPPEALPRVEVPLDAIRKVATGDLEPLIDATVKTIVADSTVTDAERAHIAERVRAAAGAFADMLRQRQSAEQALRSRLDIDIAEDKISATKPEALQSMEVTFTVDEIEDVVSTLQGGAF
jgi:hypothetical protein